MRVLQGLSAPLSTVLSAQGELDRALRASYGSTPKGTPLRTPGGTPQRTPQATPLRGLGTAATPSRVRGSLGRPCPCARPKAATRSSCSARHPTPCIRGGAPACTPLVNTAPRRSLAAGRGRGCGECRRGGVVADRARDGSPRRRARGKGEGETSVFCESPLSSSAHRDVATHAHL